MKLTLKELDSIFDETVKKFENKPMYTEPYQNGILAGMRFLRTAIEVRLRSETKQGTIQDVINAKRDPKIVELLKSCDCDFIGEAHKPRNPKQTTTIIFNGLDGIEFTVEVIE